MPPGSPFNSFALPYPIRVDCFSTISPSASEPHNAALHLLSHTHSDHIVGLQAKSFSQSVFCSASAKEMLLKHEVYKERALHEEKYRAEHNHTFRHLKVDPYLGANGELVVHGAKDLLKVLPMNTPTEVELDGDKKVTITLFDANHCPGAVMFLIEGAEGAILHTGDFRAEPWFLNSLKHNPYLQPYLALSDGVTPSDGNGIVKTLEAIYLDTACVMQTHEVPSKDDATTGLISLLKLYPPSTYFFINAWTWGYEDILKAIARAFNSKIHLDDYKYRVHSLLSSDPLLQTLGTTDPDETRFHACERFARCHHVNVDREGNCINDDDDLSSEDTFDAANRILLRETANNAWHSTRTSGRARKVPKKLVVYINPVSSMTPERWVEYQATTRKQLISGSVVRSLLVPLSRHSPLPELQAFVSLFRPKRIIPNTLDPSLKNLDWAGIDRVFQSCCSKPQSAGSRYSIPPAPIAEDLLFLEVAHECKVGSIQPHPNDEEDDVAVKNIVSDATDDADLEARVMAKKWLIGPGYGVEPSVLKGRNGRRVDVLRSWLGLRKWDDSQFSETSSSPLRLEVGSDVAKGKRGAEGLSRLQSGGYKSHRIIRRDARNRSSSDNEFDSTDDEDNHARTAHKLFASSDSGKDHYTHALWERSSFSFDLSDEEDAAEVEASLTPKAANKDGLQSGQKANLSMGRMTPKSSPVKEIAPRLARPDNSTVAMNFRTTTPNTKKGASFRPEPFALTQSPLIAQARSLYFSPSSPAVSPSPVRKAIRHPQTPHKQGSRPKKITRQTLDSPIHLISSSPSSKSRSQNLKASSLNRLKRRHSGTKNERFSSPPLSSPSRAKERASGPLEMIDLSLIEERPTKRYKAVTSSELHTDRSRKEVNDISQAVRNPKNQLASSAISARSPARKSDQLDRASSALNSPQTRLQTSLRVSVTSPAVVTNKRISPRPRRKSCTRIVRSSPHRTKSELLDIQLRVARKTALALSPNIASAFEAKYAKVEQRRDHARLKETNAVEYAFAEVKYNKRRIEEFDRKIRGNATWTRQDDEVDWERSRMLQRRATEDMRQGRKPTFPKLDCVKGVNNDDL
ncbi:hypothetical protein GGU10DRAFT_313 [Lentinula aff. detonsa]|uniref:Protein artemis n=1 Tax=Lentinula aff. detonsa TaxID=2804958 RepID=A0AA38NU39_9AGAR|nr:hypothetical protein GGU10DRAFT_313 [Lentinula aff. detonsa]